MSIALSVRAAGKKLIGWLKLRFCACVFFDTEKIKNKMSAVLRNRDFIIAGLEGLVGAYLIISIL
jgi:hypothetical protein